MFSTIITILAVILFLSLKIIMQYQEGVKFTLGRFSGVMKPGLRVVIPIIQTYQKIDKRIDVSDVPDQEAITKDNVSLRINAVLYYKINNSKDAVIKVENYGYAISQLAQTTMRNVVGEVTLDELLSKRDLLSQKIKLIVDKTSETWGIDVVSVELKHIELPDQMKRSMAREAESEREKRAVIIQAEGEAIASENIMEAAKTLGGAGGALHLRTLQNLGEISSDPSNTVVFMIPIEGVKALEGDKK